jgi:putative holliday junction resolvase
VFHNQSPVNGRILALDLGKKRIGVAISDPLGITAQGLPTVQRTTIRADVAELERICVERDVTLIVLGLPLHMDGKESRQSQYTREFADYLTGRTGREVRFWDERMTSIEAGRVLKESGISIAKRAKAVDKLAAQILLESFLGAEANARGDGAFQSPMEYED